MTPENAAQNLADELAAAHSQLAAVTAAVKTFTREASKVNPLMGPINRQVLVQESQAIEGALNRLHLNLVPFDPRPVTYDGGGK